MRSCLDTDIDPNFLYGSFSHDFTAAMLVYQTKEWRPYWCTRLTLWELNTIFMQILSFVSLNQ